MSQFAAVVWKELSQVANRRRFAVERLLVVLFSAVLFAVMAYSLIYGSDSPDYRAMSEFGFAFSTALGMVLLIMLSIAAVAYAADSLSSEYLRRTLIFLLVTPLSATTILASKLVAVCIRLLVGLVLAMPIIALLTSMGGVDWRMIAGGALAIVANVFVYGSLGLRAAALERTPARALVRAFIYAFVWYCFGSNITFASFGALAFRGAGFLGVFLIVSALNFLIAAGIFFLAVRAFRRRVFVFLEGEEKRTALTPQPPRKRWFAARKYPLSSIARRFIPPGMTLKELSTWSLTSSLSLPILFGLSWLFAAMDAYLDQPYEWLAACFAPARIMTLFVVDGGLLLLVLSIMASTRITAERQAGTLQTLGLTILGPFRILAGKGAAVLLAQLPAIALLFAHAAFILAVGVVPARLGPLFVLAVFLALVHAVTLGLYFSLAAKNRAVSGVAVLTTGLAGYVAVFLAAPLSRAGFSECAPFLFCLLFLLLILLRNLRRVLPSIAHWLSYALILLLCSLGLGLAFRGKLPEELFPAMILAPLGTLLWFEGVHANYPAALYVITFQLALLAWMVAVCLSTFNAQLRRSA